MSRFLPRLSRKRLAALAHDLVMTALAIVICYAARFGSAAFTYRLDEMAQLAAIILPAAAVIYRLFGLYSAVWRFASIPDLVSILKAVTTLAAIMAIIDFATRGGILVPRTIVFLFWFVAGALLAGPRLAFRSYRDRHLRTYGRNVENLRVPTLILGTGRAAEVLIRSLETDPAATLKPVGLLAMKSRHVGQRIRGVPILGTGEDLRTVARRLRVKARAPLRLVVTDEAFREQEKVEDAVATARSLGLTVERISPAVASGPAFLRPRLTGIDIADMHPKAELDPRAFASLVAGKRIAVTGGGGVVGAEICRQAAAAGCSRLLILEHAELALYECSRSLRAEHPNLSVEGRLGDVRDRRAVEDLLAAFGPDVVFHAAAMKDEVTIARQLATALSINLGGTISAAGAAIASGASAFVLLSTDQADEPRSVMGATKRLAELYLELLASNADSRLATAPCPTRLAAIRFPSIYSASGPTISTIRSQLSRGGPILLPAAEEKGLLMALDEGMSEVLRAVAEALGAPGPSVVVTADLGQPVLLEAVVDRMIRLAGLEPGTDVTVSARPPRPKPQEAAELQAKVAVLVDRARADPHLALREILGIAHIGADETEIVASVARLSGSLPRRAESTATRLH